MLVERIWADNDLRNFHYLIACPETGEALAVDPLSAQRCLEVAKQRGWEITQVLNTHEHYDHIGGNAAIVRATRARVLTHAAAAERIGGVDQGLQRGDIVRVGRTVELECLDTPGHTLAHVCLLTHTDHPALFCGDTLFNAGVGNCHNGGDPVQLYETVATQLSRLPNHTRVYPGHDYFARNLAFTLQYEPNNAAARQWQIQVQDQQGAQAPVSTVADEKNMNIFLRLNNTAVINSLQSLFPDIDTETDPCTIFLKLRELRNRW
jgi:hydroxyacylglutathione hydrolase